MSETIPTPEPNREKAHSPELPQEPTSAQLAEACREVLSEEDCADIEAMEFEDGLGYVFSLLIANGIEGPRAFLAEWGILEAREDKEAASVPESLGFVETAELAQLHTRLVEALLASEDVARHAVAYQAAAETIVDEMEDYPRGQIALTLQLGLIAQEAGQIEMYVGYLEQARTYAGSLGQDEIVSRIDALIGAI